MPSLIRPDKTEVKWQSFAAKSLVLSPKAQAGCRSALHGTEREEEEGLLPRALPEVPVYKK
jgi:hypothetical protein